MKHRNNANPSLFKQLARVQQKKWIKTSQENQSMDPEYVCKWAK